MVGPSANPVPPPPSEPFPRSQSPYSPYSLGPQPSGTVPTLFNPTEEDEASLFRLLADPAYSLLDVAAFHETSVSALSLWMARPDVAERLQAFESATAYKARQSAASVLPDAVKALTLITRAYSDTESKAPVAPSTEAREHRHRHAETARRASWLIFRIARFYATPPIPRAPRPLVQSPEPPRSGPGPTDGLPPFTQSDLDALASILSAASAPTRQPAPEPPATDRGTGILPVSTPSTPSTSDPSSASAHSTPPPTAPTAPAFIDRGESASDASLSRAPAGEGGRGHATPGEGESKAVNGQPPSTSAAARPTPTPSRQPQAHTGEAAHRTPPASGRSIALPQAPPSSQDSPTKPTRRERRDTPASGP